MKWACETNGDCRQGQLCGSDKICISAGAGSPDALLGDSDTDGTFTDVPAELPSAPNGPWEEVAAGGEHSCAINAEGRIRCWGGDTNGEVSDAPVTNGWHGIAAGNGFSCALDSTGKPLCWGNNEWQQSAPPLGRTYSQISLGYSHGCGIELPDGRVSCWGYSLNRQTEGPGNEDGWVQVAAGIHYGCARKGIGTQNLSCWGQVDDGQDVPPLSLSYATDIAVSVDDTWDLSLALSASGDTHRWGVSGNSWEFDDVDEIANGSLCMRRSDGNVTCLNIQSPPAERVFAKLGPGWRHQCGILVDDSLFCWGDPTNGKTQAPSE